MNNYPGQFNNNYQPNGGFQPNYGYNPYSNGPAMFKSREKKAVSTVGKVSGICVISFAALGTLIGLVLSNFPKIVTEYTYNSAFSNSFNMLITMLTLGLPFFLGYLFLKKRGLSGGIPLGRPYDKTDFWLLIPIGVACCVLGSFATGMLSTFVDAVFGIEFSQPDDGSDYSTVSGVAMSLLQTAFVPAFIEEFTIRGVVMQSLRRYGDGFAIIMSAAVFALMHGNMVQIPFAFIAGVALGYIVIKTGTMWTGIIIHFLNNAAAILSLTLMDRLTEAQSSTVLSVYYVLVFALGILCLVAYMKRNRNFMSCLSAGSVTCLKTSEKVSAFVLNISMILAILIFGYETSLYIS